MRNLLLMNGVPDPLPNPTEDRTDEDGLITAIIEAVYKPGAPAATSGAPAK